MQIQNSPSVHLPVATARPRASQAAAEASADVDRFDQAVTIKDLQLLRKIQTQEMVIRGSYAVPWVSAVLAGAGTYMATQSLLGATGMAAPLGLLVGAGVAEWISAMANEKLEAAQAQLGVRG